MLAAQLLEQLQAAAIGQHHVQYHGRRRVLGQGLACALAIVAGTHGEPFLGQPAAEQLAQFLVIINQ
ncbi:hypothetical protein D3C79_1104740 [compost metagenome]